MSEAAISSLAEKALEAPIEAVKIEASADHTPTDAERIFTSMRTQVAEVFPDEDDVAWSAEMEDYQKVQLDRPQTEFSEWVEQNYDGSDEFTQLFTRRIFMVWDELESSGFIANNKEMWDHQKALFAWAALNICTGSREDAAKLLIRSPYGSGKSLINGLIAKAFRDAQLDLMLRQGVDHKKIPTGAQIFRKEAHVLQNVGGPQHSIVNTLRPERVDMNMHWRDMESVYGEDFTDFFTFPRIAKHPFYALFRAENEDEDLVPIQQRIEHLLSSLGDARGRFEESPRGEGIISTLIKLANNEIVFTPDHEGVLQEKLSQLTAEQLGEDAQVFKGDSGFAFAEGEHYHVKTSSKRTTPNKDTYSSKVNFDDPSQFAFVDGTALTRIHPRADIAHEIAKRCRALFLDEAGYYNPNTVSDTVEQINKQVQMVIGVTGQDKGVAGWKRSPTISEARMIQMGLMKPIAYQSFGDTQNPPSAGSQEAWQQYRDIMFEPVKTAETLGLPQPHEVDTLIPMKARNIHQYATNIAKAHEEEGIPVEIYCYHAGLGVKKVDLLKAFNAPKAEGDSRRILIGVDTMLAEALTFPNVGCIDIVDTVYRFPREQLSGRLQHIRNLPGEDETEERQYERSVARTYFREQALHKGQDTFLRTAAKDQGYEGEIPDKDAEHIPLRIIVDADGYHEDFEWEDLSDPEPVQDTPAVRRRTQKAKGEPMPTYVGEPLALTNPIAIEKEQKRLASIERRKNKKRLLDELALLEGTRRDNSPYATRSNPPVFESRLSLDIATIPDPSFNRAPSVRVQPVVRAVPAATVVASSIAAAYEYIPELNETFIAPGQKKATKKKGDESEGVTVVLNVQFDANGMATPECLEGLLAQVGASSLIGSLSSSATSYFQQDGLRGEELAAKIVKRAVDMGRKSAERKHAVEGKSASGKHIGVRTR